MNGVSRDFNHKSKGGHPSEASLNQNSERTRVKRYKVGSKGPLHETLYETAHGAVKITRPQIRPSDGRRRINEEYVYVTFKFPKKYGLTLTKALYQEEADEIMSYFKTRKEETIWK